MYVFVVFPTIRDNPTDQPLKLTVLHIFIFTVLDRKPNVVDKKWAGQIPLSLKLCMSKPWIRQLYCTRQHLRWRRESEQEQRWEERVPFLL